MQKQKRQFIVIVLLFAVCVLAYIGLQVYSRNQEENEKKAAEAAKITVTDINAADLTEFSYQYEKAENVFENVDGIWYYKEDKSISIDQDQITAMLQTVTAVEAKESISDYGELADYGLKTPSNTITLKTADQTITILLGDENNILNQDYLKTADKEDVYLVETGIRTAFQKSLADLTVSEEETENTEEG